MICKLFWNVQSALQIKRRRELYFNSCVFSVQVSDINYDIEFLTGRGGDYICWTHTVCLISCLARAWCNLFLFMGPFRKEMGRRDRERVFELGMPSLSPFLSHIFRHTRHVAVVKLVLLSCFRWSLEPVSFCQIVVLWKSSQRGWCWRWRFCTYSCWGLRSNP